ncbi:MAG: hypothetical protein U0L12_06800 [Ruminococcus sp.]|nr:hypothetical protein [Ruminococcus sp.]
MKTDKNFKKRVVMCVLGVLVCGFSVGFFKRATLGVDPFQSFMGGLDALIPMEFGTLYVIANICLLLFSLFADKHYIGLATIINLSVLGYVAQYSHELMLAWFPELSLVGRFIFLIIGIVTMCFASAFYFVADLGVSTYDAVALIITGTWKIGQFRYVRIICDFVCVAVGVILYILASGSFSGINAIVGVGTIITAFFMGPLIDFFVEKVAKPFLNEK